MVRSLQPLQLVSLFSFEDSLIVLCLGQLLLQDTQLRRLPKPSTWTFKNFFKWIFSENAFGPNDQNYIYHQHDFIALQESDSSWLDDIIIQLVTYCNRGAFRVSSHGILEVYYWESQAYFLIPCRPGENGRRVCSISLLSKTESFHQDHNRRCINCTAVDPSLRFPIGRCISCSNGWNYPYILVCLCDCNFILHECQ